MPDDSLSSITVLPDKLQRSSSIPKTSCPKVLCIDDDPDVTEGLNRNFRNAGIETLLAYHGTQGYWLACTEKPDLIIIDLRMPRGNGEQVIQSLRQNTLTRYIPIIVLTGVHEYGIRQRTLELGADCFLEKPATFSELMQQVNRLV